MLIRYKNNKLEKAITAVNVLTAVVVAASFVMLFGFHRPLLSTELLYTVQLITLFIFIIEKGVRFFNSFSKLDYLRAFGFQVPILIALVVLLFGAGRWFAETDPIAIRHITVGVYLVLQVIIKVCRTVVNLAASGRNPTRTLILSFLVLIITGAGVLMLPKSASTENLSFVDALFTSTSATCVTGLVVKDTGKDFTLMGQAVILVLIQLGGLGIVVFGAVFALLLGQAFSVRESAAMQDLLSARTLSKLGNMIAFIFLGTLFFELLGTVGLYRMWGNSPAWTGSSHQQWFYSLFHSISAFCNAGFSLFDTSFIRYNSNWQIYFVVCPLIILGGLGFGVLYDLFGISVDKIKRFFKKKLSKSARLSMETPVKMRMQTKVVLCVSATLIIFGALALMLFEHYTGHGSSKSGGFLGALFQSVTARTAGFNTIDISAMSVPSRFIIIILMFIGGSPGSTAGGIKTATFAVVLMTAIAALRKRSEVEMFKRSVRIVVVGRAITVTLLFVFVLFTSTLALSITENTNGFDMSQISFEAASALGTVGLSTGITSSLTTAGKWIIILTMLIGRLGPLTLLAALTFNLKPAKYSYAEEAIIVG